MNVILSLVLCLAMLLGGGSKLPAEPETATTWTVRSAVLTLGDESVALAPEARLSLAAGAERAAMHFEFGDGEQVRMPLSLEAAPDALRFALSDAGRAYNLSAEELEKLFYEMNGIPTDGEMMEILSGYIYGYGALMASMLHDPAGMRRHREELTRLLFERCATLEGETEVEIGGQSYPAQKFRLKSDSAMLDALRECDWAELADFLNSTLDLLNYSAGASAGSFEEFYTSSAGEQAAQAMAAMPELLLNVCETEEFTYFGYDGMEFQSGANPGFQLETRKAESILRPEGATAEADLAFTVGDLRIEIALTEALAGDPYAPDGAHLTCGLRFVPQDESGDAPLEANLRFDAVKDAEGKFSGALRIQPPTEIDGAALPFDTEVGGKFSDALSIEIDGAALPFDELTLAFAPGSEDGATSISLTATDAGEIFAGLGFEVLRSEAAPADYFEGAQMYDFAVEDLDTESVSPLVLALMADSTQLALDGATLLRDPSVQAAGELIQRFYAEMVASREEEEEEEETGYVTVATPEEADAIYEGELPAYQPPEGYALTQIKVLPDEARLYYATAEGERSFRIDIDEWHYQTDYYVFDEGGARRLNEAVGTAYPGEEGRTNSAYVHLPDGQHITFLFDYALTPDEIQEFLDGIAH